MVFYLSGYQIKGLKAYDACWYESPVFFSLSVTLWKSQDRYEYPPLQKFLEKLRR